MSRRRLVLDLRDRRPVWSIPAWSADEIRDALPDGWEAVVVDAETDGTGDGTGPSPEALRAVRGAEVYLGYGMPRPLFRAATEGPEARLRWAHSASAGVGGSLHAEMLASDVVLTNSAGVHAEPIAETAIGMMLHFARGLDLAVRARAERRWDRAAFQAADAPVRELAGSTLGVFGLGGIGRAVARRARALGMEVVAARRTSTGGPDGVEVIAGDDALDRLLPRSDVLLVSAPRTVETEGAVDADALARLPDGAVVVVVSRGGIVDEAALADALRSGRLRGAALDVFAAEPLPADSPLWDLPNVLLTPHVSGVSRRFWERETELIVDNLRRWIAGEPLRNVVDKRAGY